MKDPLGTKCIEADIVINGETLTFGQAMALRVAVTSFIADMSQPDALGADDTGKSIAAGYVRNLQRVLRYMFKNQPETTAPAEPKKE